MHSLVDYLWIDKKWIALHMDTQKCFAQFLDNWINYVSKNHPPVVDPTIYEAFV